MLSRKGRKGKRREIFLTSIHPPPRPSKPRPRPHVSSFFFPPSHPFISQEKRPKRPKNRRPVLSASNHPFKKTGSFQKDMFLPRPPSLKSFPCYQKGRCRPSEKPSPPQLPTGAFLMPFPEIWAFFHNIGHFLQKKILWKVRKNLNFAN